MMFKFLSNNLPSLIRTIFIRNNEIHNYNTRNRTTLHVPIGTTETIYVTFRFHGIYIWNLISERIPTDVSYSCFKHILNRHIPTPEHNYRLRTYLLNITYVINCTYVSNVHSCYRFYLFDGSRVM